MKKKIISIVTTFALMCSIMAPSALALTSEFCNEPTIKCEYSYTTNRTIVTSSDGDSLEFESYELDSGAIVMDYYYNGELVYTYFLMDENGNLFSNNTITNENVREEFFRALSSTNLGTFFYNKSGNFFNPNITVSVDTLSAKTGTKRITSSVGASFADITAAIATGIIAGALGIVAAPATLAAAIAASILSTMIADAGGKVVNNAITVAISDSYDCVVLSKQMTATFRDSSISKNYSKTYPCTLAYVAYDGENYSKDQYASNCGYNPDNWALAGFANLSWKDTIGTQGFSYPGLSYTIVNDPSN